MNVILNATNCGSGLHCLSVIVYAVVFGFHSRFFSLRTSLWESIAALSSATNSKRRVTEYLNTSVPIVPAAPSVYPTMNTVS